MLIKMVRADFRKNKAITAVLFVFIMMSALLTASGTNMMAEMANSLNALFTKSDAPHFVQMHTGEINHREIDKFAENNNLVKRNQTVEMILIDGFNIDMGGASAGEKNSVMDHYFMKQNESFDFLLNLKSEVINVSPGEIAVPIYYMQRENIKIGDKVKISSQSFQMEFTVVDFVRDVQMNPSIIHSKRFVVNEADLETLKGDFGTVEYLIEFQLHDLGSLSAFRNAYESSSMPKEGPTIDIHLFKTLNAVTDGIVAAVIILISLLLGIIAILCIRFILLAAVEEDYREIGVMKAIGIGQLEIKKLYILKYAALGTGASILGYAGSLSLNHLFTFNITLYMGTAEKGALLNLIPVLAVILVLLFVLFFCFFTLRRFNTITPIEALREGSIGETDKSRLNMSINKRKRLNIHVSIGLKDVLGRFKVYRLLFFVFLISSFMILVPVNFLHTIQSPDFINYMGVERSDIRIDLPQSEQAAEEFRQIVARIGKDSDVERFSATATSRFKVMNSEGIQENMMVETGDFSTFPLEYLKGRAPLRENEIALSYLNSREFEKNVGDTMSFVMDGKTKKMVVSGIYQDVTNGGRTAKAIYPYNPDTVLSYKISADIKPHASIDEKIEAYAGAFQKAKVTGLKDYLLRTFENTINQLKAFTVLAIVVSICISMLITSLFLKMLMAKDRSQIAIMRSIGFCLRDIQIQYATRSMTVLFAGIIAGTAVSNTIGQSLVSFFISFMGAPEIKFVIDPIKAFLLCPLMLIIAVAAAAMINLTSIKRTNIADMNV